MDDKKEKSVIRCAVYTRVSTSEGLEQEFTSLDNQRESAESYIQSQKSEGWVMLHDCYNDGGFTGANTNRPALQKLIDDIKARKIDCVVVYKVDRLSRSLLDFSQLLEFFDKNSVTFVSVTQAFNTNTSMGRLTLNILLSFAQFEREIISERTRDKMGAARKKGKWVGGCVPLGYDLDKENHKLVVNTEEAKIVREIFKLYLEKRSLLEVVKVLNGKGFRTKIRKLTDGKHGGGIKFSITSIERILYNAYYIGKVRYQNVLYQGEQDRIVDDKAFMEVHDILKANTRKPRARMPIGKKMGPLSKLLRCTACDSSMYLAVGVKHGVFRYSHYVCLNAQKRGYHECPTKLVNSGLMESKVIECLKKITKDQALEKDAWESSSLEQKSLILKNIVKVIGYNGKTSILEITLNETQETHTFEVSKSELKYKSVIPKDRLIRTEPQLRQNLLLAHQIQGLIDDEKAKDIKEVSGWLNLSQQRVNQIMGLLFLSPQIQEAIIFQNDPYMFEIPEYKLRAITDEHSWDRQYVMWQNLIQKAS
jgi:site-specific DNA recombinase